MVCKKEKKENQLYEKYEIRVSQVVLVVKNTPTSAGD